MTVTDNNGCTDVATVTITQPSNILLVDPVVTSDYNGQDISCATVCDGAVKVQVSGGILDTILLGLLVQQLILFLVYAQELM